MHSTQFGCAYPFGCGPEFDAQQVDFTELIHGNRAYMEQERLLIERHLRQVGL